MPPKGTTPALTPEQGERYAQVLELRKMGRTFDEIAAALNYADRSGAKHAYDAALARLARETAEELRTLENERLDDLWSRTYVQLLEAEGDDFVKLIGTLLKVSSRRAGLMGLDAPKQVELAGRGGGPIETDIGEMLRQRVAAIDAAQRS